MISQTDNQPQTEAPLPPLPGERSLVAHHKPQPLGKDNAVMTPEPELVQAVRIVLFAVYLFVWSALGKGGWAVLAFIAGVIIYLAVLIYASQPIRRDLANPPRIMSAVGDWLLLSGLLITGNIAYAINELNRNYGWQAAVFVPYLLFCLWLYRSRYYRVQPAHETLLPSRKGWLLSGFTVVVFVAGAWISITNGFGIAPFHLVLALIALAAIILTKPPANADK